MRTHRLEEYQVQLCILGGSIRLAVLGYAEGDRRGRRHIIGIERASVGGDTVYLAFQCAASAVALQPDLYRLYSGYAFFATAVAEQCDGPAERRGGDIGSDGGRSHARYFDEYTYAIGVDGGWGQLTAGDTRSDPAVGIAAWADLFGLLFYQAGCEDDTAADRAVVVGIYRKYNTRIVMKGIGVSQGIAIGRAWVLRPKRGHASGQLLPDEAAVEREIEI